MTLYYQSLDREETQALVQAMESGVERVLLNSVTLDMETLETYSGQGRCWDVRLLWPARDGREMWRVNLKEPLKLWAVNRGWAVISDDKCELDLYHFT